MLSKCHRQCSRPALIPLYRLANRGWICDNLQYISLGSTTPKLIINQHQQGFWKTVTLLKIKIQWTCSGHYLTCWYPIVTVQQHQHVSVWNSMQMWSFQTHQTQQTYWIEDAMPPKSLVVLSQKWGQIMVWCIASHVSSWWAGQQGCSQQGCAIGRSNSPVQPPP